MTTIDEVRAEIEMRLTSVPPRLPAQDISQLSAETRSGHASPLDEALRRLGIHSMAVSTHF